MNFIRTNTSKQKQYSKELKDPDHCDPEIIRDPITCIKGHTGLINAISVSGNGSYIACGGKSLKIWKIMKDSNNNNSEELEYLIERNISKSQAF